MARVVHINATNIGRQLSGIGRYSLALAREFLKTDQDLRIYANAHAREHFNGEAQDARIHWVSRHVSPDYGFRGHLARLSWAQVWGLQHRNDVVFNTSPLEVCVDHPQQIVTVHDLIPMLYPQWHRRQASYFRYVLPRLLRTCSRIVTVSEHTKLLVQDQFQVAGEKIQAIPNGVDPFFCEDPSTAREDFLLFVGRPSPTKNLQGLLNALAILAKRGTTPRLKIVSPTLGDIAVPAEIADHIEVVGAIDDSQLRELYRTAAALVMPSYYEGFGLPAAEAIACGCAVVVANNSSFPEVCGDAAIYIDAHRVESIAHGIETALSHPGKVKRTQTVQSWREVAARYSELFRDSAIYSKPAART